MVGIVLERYSLTDNSGFIPLLKYPQHDAVLGGLVGLLLGDAIGVPFEFNDPDSLPDRSLIDIIPPATFPRSHAGIPPGTWSDDGAQALCLLASLQANDKLVLPDFAGRLCDWMENGYVAVDGDVFDIGIQTSIALDRIRDGVPAYQAGGSKESDNGNGSLMRVLPLALWHQGSDEALVYDAHLQSLPTHGHKRSMVACAYYCLVARAYLSKRSDPWESADINLKSIYLAWPNQEEGREFLDELQVLRDFPKRETPQGTGYVLDTIWSARYAVEASTFQDVIRNAVALGHDTDTTAAVAGGLAGIRFGLSGIPANWLDQLRGFELVDPLIKKMTV